MRTPWGIADSVELLGKHGIKRIDTPSHGGYWVPAKARELMPKEALKTFAGLGWYEEDGDWALVALSFPDLFRPEAVADARITIAKWHSPAVCAAFEITPDPNSFYRERKEV